LNHSVNSKAALLNTDRLDFDERLTFEAIEDIVDLARYGATEPEQVAERARGCRILITKEMPLRASVIEQLPEDVGLICEAGTGYDNVDLKAARQRDITVCNVPGYSTHAVAQLTLCFILALSTGVFKLIRNVAVGDLEDFHRGLRPRSSELFGKTLGVIGAGAIGGRVIRLARAFEMNVLVHKPSPGSWNDDGIKQVGLAELLANSHFVTLHCLLNEHTRHIIRAETLRGMKKGAYLINTARGGLVHQGDLAAAVASGQIAGAALDVQDPEPPPPDDALWSMPDRILTPHVGWKALEARRRLIAGVARNIRAFLDGEPVNVVNDDSG
jgi:lactate dehydrogenase-like 2-hydroxyacid dehydrogenase